MLSEADSSPGRNACAYCGKVGVLTREHLLADFLYRESPDQKLGYNQRADKFMTWEPVARDVCEICNNGPLSMLDNYARNFLSSIDYKRTYPVTVSLAFEYNYDSLLRWLLKVSYNAARALSTVQPLLQDCVRYIRDGGDRPSVAFLALEVVRDTPIADNDRPGLPLEARAWRFIPTKMFRVGYGGLNTSATDAIGVPDYYLRFVAMNAWQFYICLVSRESSRPERRRLARLFQDSTPSAVFLKPEGDRCSVEVSTKTGLESYEFQGRRVVNQWRQYIEDTLKDAS